MWRDIWTFLGERPGIAICGVFWVAVVLPLTVAAALSRRLTDGPATFDWRQRAIAAWELACENKDGYADRIVISSDPKPRERDAVHLANARRLLWVMMNAPHDTDAAKVVKTGSATVEDYDFTLNEFEGAGASMISMAHWEVLD